MDFTKKQKFSIRKLTLGVASILIGTSLVFGSQEVNAQETVTNNQSSIISEGIQIDYLAVDEDDLTALEKSLIRYEDISEEIASKNDTYILVYQNKSITNHQLPRTGSETGLLSLLAAGAVLLVVYRLGKKKSLLLGVVVLTTTASVALSNKGNAAELLRDLAHHVSTYSSGQSLNALVIDGYDYVGYIRDEDVPTETALFNLVSSYRGLMVTEKQNDHVDKPLLADHLIKPDTSVLENGEDKGNLAFTPSPEEVVPEVIPPTPVPEEVVPEVIPPTPVPEEVVPEVIPPTPVPEEVVP
ncbi:YSIRK-type signal peptide-containing protein, partial [Streptococcus fryi]